ncbi:MAG: ribosome biogenesis factor YjgA [Thiomonas sp.]|uniref:ribosome biogenesis factor YjgA n=1 Tax=Thiomonas sp. TaxID=2047785 RepID=UPI002A361DBB|nr:ribosome biogenesis factor YjgA [Thiomonas sp.]MDY0331615.1 ribosome biogenesis factor YjgA [Thiomonas sp.]
MKFPHHPSDTAEAQADDRPPSKSQVKRDMLALQELGERLIALPAHIIRQADLPEALRDAVLEAQRITAHGGRKRQTQYVGKLMRTVDAAAVRAIIASATLDDRASVARMHALERWRDTLLADDQAQTEFLDKFPGADAQQLRQLVRGARAEVGVNKPPRLTRQLFQFVKAAIATHDDASRSADHEPLPRF